MAILSPWAFFGGALQMSSYRGVCVFDVDGTIARSDGVDRIVDECQKRGFAVGVATASTRTSAKVCDPTHPDYWATPKLCQALKDNGDLLFSSDAQLYGREYAKGAPWPEGYATDTQGQNPGFKKAWKMNYDRERLFPSMPTSCLVLFDDDPHYLQGLAAYNAKHGTAYESQCARNSCDASLPDKLSFETVAKKLDAMHCGGPPPTAGPL